MKRSAIGAVACLLALIGGCYAALATKKAISINKTRFSQRTIEADAAWITECVTYMRSFHADARIVEMHLTALLIAIEVSEQEEAAAVLRKHHVTLAVEDGWLYVIRALDSTFLHVEKAQSFAATIDRLFEAAFWMNDVPPLKQPPPLTDRPKLQYGELHVECALTLRMKRHWHVWLQLVAHHATLFMRDAKILRVLQVAHASHVAFVTETAIGSFSDGGGGGLNNFSHFWALVDGADEAYFSVAALEPFSKHVADVTHPDAAFDAWTCVDFVWSFTLAPTRRPAPYADVELLGAKHDFFEMLMEFFLTVQTLMTLDPAHNTLQSIYNEEYKEPENEDEEHDSEKDLDEEEEKCIKRPFTLFISASTGTSGDKQLNSFFGALLNVQILQRLPEFALKTHHPTSTSYTGLWRCALKPLQPIRMEMVRAELGTLAAYAYVTILEGKYLLSVLQFGVPHCTLHQTFVPMGVLTPALSERLLADAFTTPPDFVISVSLEAADAAVEAVTNVVTLPLSYACWECARDAKRGAVYTYFFAPSFAANPGRLLAGAQTEVRRERYVFGAFGRMSVAAVFYTEACVDGQENRIVRFCYAANNALFAADGRLIEDSVTGIDDHMTPTRRLLTAEELQRAHSLLHACHNAADVLRWAAALPDELLCIAHPVHFASLKFDGKTDASLEGELRAICERLLPVQRLALLTNPAFCRLFVASKTPATIPAEFLGAGGGGDVANISLAAMLLFVRDAPLQSVSHLMIYLGVLRLRHVAGDIYSVIFGESSQYPFVISKGDAAFGADFNIVFDCYSEHFFVSNVPIVDLPEDVRVVAVRRTSWRTIFLQLVATVCEAAQQSRDRITDLPFEAYSAFSPAFIEACKERHSVWASLFWLAAGQRSHFLSLLKGSIAPLTSLRNFQRFFGVVRFFGGCDDVIVECELAPNRFLYLAYDAVEDQVAFTDGTGDRIVLPTPTLGVEDFWRGWRKLRSKIDKRWPTLATFSLQTLFSPERMALSYEAFVGGLNVVQEAQFRHAIATADRATSKPVRFVVGHLVRWLTAVCVCDGNDIPEVATISNQKQGIQLDAEKEKGKCSRDLCAGSAFDAHRAQFARYLGNGSSLPKNSRLFVDAFVAAVAPIAKPLVVAQRLLVVLEAAAQLAEESLIGAFSATHTADFVFRMEGAFCEVRARNKNSSAENQPVRLPLLERVPLSTIGKEGGEGSRMRDLVAFFAAYRRSIAAFAFGKVRKQPLGSLLKRTCIVNGAVCEIGGGDCAALQPGECEEDFTLSIVRTAVNGADPQTHISLLWPELRPDGWKMREIRFVVRPHAKKHALFAAALSTVPLIGDVKMARIGDIVTFLRATLLEGSPLLRDNRSFELFAVFLAEASGECVTMPSGRSATAFTWKHASWGIVDVTLQANAVLHVAGRTLRLGTAIHGAFGQSFAEVAAAVDAEIRLLFGVWKERDDAGSGRLLLTEASDTLRCILPRASFSDVEVGNAYRIDKMPHVVVKRIDQTTVDVIFGTRIQTRVCRRTNQQPVEAGEENAETLLPNASESIAPLSLEMKDGESTHINTNLNQMLQSENAEEEMQIQTQKEQLDASNSNEKSEMQIISIKVSDSAAFLSVQFFVHEVLWATRTPNVSDRFFVSFLKTLLFAEKPPNDLEALRLLACDKTSADFLFDDTYKVHVTFLTSDSGAFWFVLQTEGNAKEFALRVDRLVSFYQATKLLLKTLRHDAVSNELRIVKTLLTAKERLQRLVDAFSEGGEFRRLLTPAAVASFVRRKFAIADDEAADSPRFVAACAFVAEDAAGRKPGSLLNALLKSLCVQPPETAAFNAQNSGKMTPESDASTASVRSRNRRHRQKELEACAVERISKVEFLQLPPDFVCNLNEAVDVSNFAMLQAPTSTDFYLVLLRLANDLQDHAVFRHKSLFIKKNLNCQKKKTGETTLNSLVIFEPSNSVTLVLALDGTLHNAADHSKAVSLLNVRRNFLLTLERLSTLMFCEDELDVLLMLCCVHRIVCVTQQETFGIGITQKSSTLILLRRQKEPVIRLTLEAAFSQNPDERAPIVAQCSVSPVVRVRLPIRRTFIEAFEVIFAVKNICTTHTLQSVIRFVRHAPHRTFPHISFAAVSHKFKRKNSVMIAPGAAIAFVMLLGGVFVLYDWDFAFHASIRVLPHRGLTHEADVWWASLCTPSHGNIVLSDARYDGGCFYEVLRDFVVETLLFSLCFYHCAARHFGLQLHLLSVTLPRQAPEAGGFFMLENVTGRVAGCGVCFRVKHRAADGRIVELLFVEPTFKLFTSNISLRIVYVFCVTWTPEAENDEHHEHEDDKFVFVRKFCINDDLKPVMHLESLMRDIVASIDVHQ